MKGRKHPLASEATRWIRGEGNGRRIGVVVPAVFDFGREILRGVRLYCKKHPGVKMEIISELGYRPEIEKSPNKIDCIVAHVDNEHAVDHLRTISKKVVVTSNMSETTKVAKVISDDIAVGRTGADYLLSLGYRRFAFVKVGECQFSEERLRGFREVVNSKGLSVEVIEGQNAIKLRENLMVIKESFEPIAVMVATDIHARWVVETFEEPLAFIPDQLAILGVDNDSLQNEICPVPLSSVRLAGERIGYEAAELGMRMARGETEPDSPIKIAPLEVVARQSTDVLMVNDPVVLEALGIMREGIQKLKDVRDVVEAVGVPRRTLEWHFKHVLNRTILGELTSIRIRRARQLLSTSSLTIAEISEEVGFSEPRLLSIVFKRVTGETPSAFRSRS